MRAGAHLLLAALIAAGCAPSAAPRVRELEIKVVGAGNGYLNVSTLPGATCTASGRSQVGGPALLDKDTRRANASGAVSWTYTSLTPTGDIEIRYEIECTEGARTVATAPPAITVYATTTSAPLAVTESTYGTVGLRTAAGVSCRVEVSVNAGAFGDPPRSPLQGQADAAGALRMTYATPRLPPGRGLHHVSCGEGPRRASQTAPFDVPDRAVSAAAMSVRVAAPAPGGERIPGNVAFVSVLTDVRDRAIARLRTSLATEWRDATRGLGGISVVDESADVVVKVLPAAGTSVHRTAADGSEDVLLYVADDRGAIDLDNLVAIALHELGHVWCCRGPGTTDGHWNVPEASDTLTGLDRFGLMNHPVMCATLRSGILSCPNRFSDRELRTMGFTSIPRATADPCVARSEAVRAQLRTGETDIAARNERIKELNARAAALLAEIRAVEARYPNGAPADVLARYRADLEAYNALVASIRAEIAEYEARVAAYNALVAELRVLQGRCA